jgi:N-acetylmuramoyl-L-alanine amidase
MGTLSVQVYINCMGTTPRHRSVELLMQMRLHYIATILTCFLSFTVDLPFTTAHAAIIPEPSLTGKTIVLDAGHGGPDSGARNDNGDSEKEITLPVTLELAHLLRQSGATVYLTRSTDDDLASDLDRKLKRRQSRDLRNRTRFAVSKGPDAFISVHCNAAPSPSWYGAQTFHMTNNPSGARLAKGIQESFKSMLLPTSREADDISTLYLLKRIPGPAILAEIGFLTNPREAVALKTQSYQQTVAFAMYTGIFDFFAQTPVNSTPGERGTD